MGLLKKKTDEFEIDSSVEEKKSLFGTKRPKEKGKKGKAEKKSQLRNVLHDVKKLKDIVICDNVNPLPDDHIQIINGNKIYVRTLYISDMPRRSVFANTFEPIFNCGHANISVFVKPVGEGKAIQEYNNAITDLEAEILSVEEKDRNRARRLARLMAEAEALVDSLDSGENRMFDVSILVTVYASSLDELNKRTDTLRLKAKEKGVFLSAPYAKQKEAFLSNLPVNNNRIGYWHRMDKLSLSTLYHYTRGIFGHKQGAPIGRNMDTHQPVAYNMFERSMNGYNMVITGKTRAGKSTFFKILALRFRRPGGVEFVGIDPEGEYGDVAVAMGGLNVQISNSSGHVFNIFEIDVEYRRIKHTGIEYEYLDLLQKMTDASYNILTIARGHEPEKAPVNDLTLGIIKDAVKECYKRLNIYHEDIESLYEKVDGVRKKKDLPTLSLWYQILKSDEFKKRYDNDTYRPHYDYLMLVMQDYVRTEDGTKLYFDGQSRGIDLRPGIPYLNFDISALHEKYERPIVQSILMGWMWEKRGKKNSEDPLKAKQLAFVFDETSHLLPYQEARQALTDFYRRAAKKFIAIISLTQKVNDYMRYEDAHAIFTNSTTKIILTHDPSEKETLKKLMELTDTEADCIITLEKGEYYIISGNQKAFVKLERLPCEIAITETDASVKKEIEQERLATMQAAATSEVN